MALGGFFAEVRELRMKYRIPEISVTVVLNVTQPHTVRTDGEPDTTVPEPSQVIAGFFNGLSTRELRLTAWAFGRAQASHDADVAGMLERARANT